MEKYNGWTNYETWNIALWVNNDSKNVQDHWHDRARELKKVHRLKDELRVAYTGREFNSDVDDFGLVNWFEVAQSIMDDVEEADRFALVDDMASEILMLADEMGDDANLGSTEEAYPQLLEDEYLIDEVNERLVQHGLKLEDVHGQLILKRC